MKEYTEIEIVDSSMGIASMLAMGKNLTFRFEDKELKRFSWGKPISQVAETVISFSSQAYYEGVSLSKGKPGAKLELFEDWKKENKIADGIIRKRYFEKAVKEDWKIKEEIEIANCNHHKIEITFSEEEMKCLTFGNIPLQMEDKWFSYMEDNTVHFFRSWTGREIFQAELIPTQHGNWMIKEFHSTKESEPSFFNTKSTFEDLLKRQIRRMKKLLE